MNTASPACVHRILDGKINEFILTETSRRALDDLFAIIENIQREAARDNLADHYNPSFIDSSVGLQPLNYAFKRMQPLMAQYPTMRRARVAILVPPNPLLTTASMIMRTVTFLRFYKLNEREQALAWLRRH